MNKYRPSLRPEPDAQFPDFAERSIDYIEGDTPSRVKLLLPATAEVDDLLQQRARAAREDEARAVEERAQRLDAQAAARSPNKAPEEPVYLTRKDNERLAAIDARAQMQLDYELVRDMVKADEGSDRHQVQVYAWDAPLKLIEDRKTTPDHELRQRDKELFGQLQKLGAFRRVCTWERMYTVLDGLRYLRASQPHFARVIDLIEARVRLAQEVDEPMCIPPILLAGPPGVGKTHFTLELARLMERPVRRHSFDAAHTASALMGSDRNWANTRYGLIFDAVCLGERADPVILLDELDKVAEHTYGGSPLAPLHSLLEPVTSANVTDISAGLQFDASHVLFVATANDLRLVPPPIQSRFQVFHIEQPTAEQSIDLAQSVAGSVHLRYSGFAEPPRRLVTLLAHLTPRQQIQALDHAYATALVNGRRHLMRQDLPAEVLQDDGSEPADGRVLH
ncbi:AAA family ATPase [Hydrogenophaga sp.]|uniref:AAA family ATPase n=1 Tax=Hydrogenophaga sp. TaxID=1904254 RepID=UPI0025C50D95|nr:AAA family ATPase [Hydrogenophaga sp.]